MGKELGPQGYVLLRDLGASRLATMARSELLGGVTVGYLR